eukprot:m.242158 g.242158  ORF g.242158 m.242158 type:complete len:233 (+) comp40212_c0_seq4:428-1126(+)
MISTSSCVLDPSPMTRARDSSYSACFGMISAFSGAAVPQRGFPSDVSLCLRHSRESYRYHHRCAITFDAERCLDPLRACPERLFPVLDDLTNATASAYLCKRHVEKVDEIQSITKHRFYRPPAKRHFAAVAPREIVPSAGETNPEIEPLKTALKDEQARCLAAESRANDLLEVNDGLEQELNQLKEHSFPELVKSFQQALYKHTVGKCKQTVQSCRYARLCGGKGTRFIRHD